MINEIGRIFFFSSEQPNFEILWKNSININHNDFLNEFGLNNQRIQEIFAPQERVKSPECVSRGNDYERRIS